MSASARVRPRLHFTARKGWTNDPHGIIHVDGKYHMFFQYNPDGLNWSPRCHWGHATSRDLIIWRQAEIALSPAEGEVGCWSGSVVIDERGPAAIYTSIAGDNWQLGRIALARPRRGMLDWARDPAHPVIEGPPKGLDIVAFRDPHVRFEGGRWQAIIGAGRACSRGCALQYSSTDLETWRFDGIVAARPLTGWSVHTGAVWECPQLLQIGGDWVMIVSAWDDGVPGSVNYAIGKYDVHAGFTARNWGSFTHGGELYATTTFRDAQGRPCAMSWLRERGNVPPQGSPWCSAMSLPHVLRIAADKLMVSQHPSLEAVLNATSGLGDVVPGGLLDVSLPGHLWRLRFGVSRYRSGGFGVNVTGNGGSFTLNGAGGSLSVADNDGAVLMTMPVSAVGHVSVDIIVDADILEVTATGTEGIASTRIPVINSGTFRISAAGGSSITEARLSTRA